MKAFIIFLIAAGLVSGALVYPASRCEPCSGRGQIAARSQRVKCADCNGKGRRSSQLQGKNVKSLGGNTPMCLTCKGRGYSMQVLEAGGGCLVCEGAGKVSLLSKFNF